VGKGEVGVGLEAVFGYSVDGANKTRTPIFCVVAMQQLVVHV